MKARLPDDEPARLDALRGYDVLDTPPEQSLDDITALAAQICRTPTALISLVDADRQWFKSRVGWEDREGSRDAAFCAHAILDPSSELIVPDASSDDRFHDNPLVTGDPPHVRFYAGVPLVGAGGHALGTLCVIDRVPRTLDVTQIGALRALRRAVVTEFELRRSRAELARRRAGEQLGELLETMGDGYVAFDREWRYVTVNARAAAMFGCKAADLLGKRYLDMYPEARDSVFHRAYVRAMAGEGPIVFENRYEPWGRWFENRVYPIPGGIAVFFNDITDRKRVELALAEAQEFADALIERLPGVFFVIDEHRRPIRCNDAFASMLGYAPPESPAPTTDAGAAAPPPFAAIVERATAEGSVNDVADLVGADGRRRTLRFDAKVSTIGGQRVLIGHGIDVTDAQIAKRRFERIFIGAPEPMSFSEIDSGRLLLVNDAFCKAFGYSRETLIGRSAVALGLWSDGEKRRAIVARLRAGERVRGVPGRVNSRSGVVRDVEISAELVESGGPGALLFMFRDVTDERAAERGLREHATQLEELSRRLLTAQEEERGRIARELHDEIGQVLTAVRLNLKVVERHSRSASAREAIADCLATVETGIERVRNLSIDLRPPMLDDLGLAAALRWLVERQPLPVSLAIDASVGEPPPTVSLACYRVVQEALTNVGRHAGATGVRVGLERSTSDLLLTVADDGRGFDPATSPGGGGFGLRGMSERVGLAGGRLEIVSAPGAGTTLRATFPWPR